MLNTKLTVGDFHLCTTHRRAGWSLRQLTARRISATVNPVPLRNGDKFAI